MDKQKDKPNKCLMCDKEAYNNLKHCIFHAKAEEKKEKDFIEELKKYIKIIQEEGNNYNFKYFIFIGNLDFKKDLNINILVNADFEGATFLGTVDFEGVTFKEYIGFRKACFKKDLIFTKNIFQGTVNLEEITFQGNADFRGAIFQGIVEFDKITFQGNANFEGAIFRGNVDFEKVTFRGDVDFEKVTFGGDVDFQINYLEKNINFSKINILNGKKLILKIDNNKGNIFFKRACLENVYLDIGLSSGISIDFTDALLKNTKLEKEKIENHILQEEEKEFSRAKQVYLLLKNNFHIIGRYDDESWAFKKEKDMERFANYKSGRYLKGVISSFFNFLYGYGEEPLKVLRFAVIIILFFSFLYFNYGISVSVPEIRNIKYDFFQNVWLAMNNTELLLSTIISFPWEDYLNSLYFSLTTFATLAYGNIEPLAITSKIIAGIESFIGPFTIALFVYTFARRTGGR